MCKCVLYCHRVATQLQFNKYIISYHIISYHIINNAWNCISIPPRVLGVYVGYTRVHVGLCVNSMKEVQITCIDKFLLTSAVRSHCTTQKGARF